VFGRGIGSTKKIKLKSNIYHDDHGEKRNVMGLVEIKVVRKGGWVHRKKMIITDLYQDY